MSKVSVIIPIYNVEKYLERCIDSVLNQTLKDIEIICVNDGSTDGSGLILDKYSKFDNVKIISQKNSGLSVARNKGLENATAKYVAFLDSDDFVDADFYEKLYENIEKHNADIACASIVRENNRKRTYLIDYKQIKTSEDIRERFVLAGCPKYNFVWNKLYVKDFLRRNKFEFAVGMLYEDMWFTPEVLETASSLVVVPDTYYHYWKQKNSIIKGECDKCRADKLMAHKYLTEKCKKYNIVPFQRYELQYKKEYKFLGIPILKEYSYLATKKFYLFGIVPILEIIKRV